MTDNAPADKSSLKRFNRDVLWNVGSLAVLGASGIVINCLILAFADSDALGVFNQVFAFFIVATQFAVGGLQTSALKHCSYVQDDCKACSVIASSAMMLTSVFAIITSAAFYFASPLIGKILQSPAVGLGVKFITPGMFLFALNKVMLMVLNGMRNMRAFAVFQALRYIFITAGIVIIIMMGLPASHLALALTGAEAALFLCLSSYITIRLFRFRFSFSKEMREWFYRHASFGLRGFMSGALVEMNTRVDVLMLGVFMSDAVVGVYSFASTFAEGFAMLNSVVRQNVDPIIGQHFASGEKEEISIAAKKIRRKFMPAMMGLALASSAVFPVIIKVISSDGELWACWGVFAILVFGTAMASGFRPFTGIIMQGGRPGTYTLILGASVFGNAALNFALIPILGIFGAATATAMTYLIEAWAVLVLAKKLFNVRL